MNRVRRIIPLLFFVAAKTPIDAAAPPATDFIRSAEISYMQISPSGDHLAFLREIDGKRDLTVSELATGKATAASDVPSPLPANQPSQRP